MGGPGGGVYGSAAGFVAGNRPGSGAGGTGGGVYRPAVAGVVRPAGFVSGGRGASWPGGAVAFGWVWPGIGGKAVSRPSFDEGGGAGADGGCGAGAASGGGGANCSHGGGAGASAPFGVEFSYVIGNPLVLRPGRPGER